MQRKCIVCLMACLVSLSVLAAETLPTLKVGTEIYTNVTVYSATATDIFFSHSRGMGNAKLKNLDPEIQKRFGFNADKAKAAEQKQADANLAFRNNLVTKPQSKPSSSQAVTGEAERQPAVAPADIPVREIHAISFRGRPAPRFAVEKWLTPAPDTKGKFVLIDFWATWCGPCRRSIPELNKLHAKFSDKLVIIGLSDESEADVRAMKSPKIDYNIAIDTSGKMKSAVGVQGIPHALILDPNGVVRFEGHPGYLNEQNVAGLLAKYSP